MLLTSRFTTKKAYDLKNVDKEELCLFDPLPRLYVKVFQMLRLHLDRLRLENSRIKKALHSLEVSLSFDFLNCEMEERSIKQLLNFLKFLIV